MLHNKPECLLETKEESMHPPGEMKRSSDGHPERHEMPMQPAMGSKRGIQVHCNSCSSPVEKMVSASNLGLRQELKHPLLARECGRASEASPQNRSVCAKLIFFSFLFEEEGKSKKLTDVVVVKNASLQHSNRQ